jgi:UDP-GlcNAc:undecaprenyl-phosphate GlcNAc-1-phosphate transferase
MLGALAMNNSYTHRNVVAALAPIVILGVPMFDMLFVMYVRHRRGLPVMLGSPDHFALRLRKWRLSTRQTAIFSCAATVVLGGLALGMMAGTAAVAASILGGIILSAILLGLVLRRIDMTL